MCCLYCDVVCTQVMLVVCTVLYCVFRLCWWFTLCFVLSSGYVGIFVLFALCCIVCSGCVDCLHCVVLCAQNMLVVL